MEDGISFFISIEKETMDIIKDSILKYLEFCKYTEQFKNDSYIISMLNVTLNNDKILLYLTDLRDQLNKIAGSKGVDQLICMYEKEMNEDVLINKLLYCLSDSYDQFNKIVEKINLSKLDELDNSHVGEFFSTIMKTVCKFLSVFKKYEEELKEISKYKLIKIEE